jgi:hypothetical protein
MSPGTSHLQMVSCFTYAEVRRFTCWADAKCQRQRLATVASEVLGSPTRMCLASLVRLYSTRNLEEVLPVNFPPRNPNSTTLRRQVPTAFTLVHCVM